MIKFNPPLAKKFVFEKHNFDLLRKRADFFYRLDNWQFKESIILDFPFETENPDTELLEKSLSALHLALGVSYWKIACPPQIETENAHVANLNFWHKVYQKGLGEFFARNQIDYRNLLNFKNICSPIKNVKPKSAIKGQKNILCVGGGKDSLAAAQLLQGDFTPLVFGNNKIAREQFPNCIRIERRLDPQLFELNESGRYYNGHVPFSLILAFSATFASLFFDARNIIVGNERSANYGNTDFLGQEVNHQWSKSWEAEQMINSYIKKNITPDRNYFSILRPYWEIKVVEIFLRDKKWLKQFSSCNGNFRREKNFQGRWCGNCPKCAFVFSLLSAFLPRSELVEIFGKNLFTDAGLQKIFHDLYAGKIKPWECVGRKDEVIAALQSACQIEAPQEAEIILHKFLDEKLVAISLEKLLNERGESFFPSFRNSPEANIRNLIT